MDGVTSDLLQQLLLAAGSQQASARCARAGCGVLQLAAVPLISSHSPCQLCNLGCCEVCTPCSCKGGDMARSVRRPNLLTAAAALVQVAEEAREMLGSVDPEAAQANDIAKLFCSSPRFPDVVACAEALTDAEVRLPVRFSTGCKRDCAQDASEPVLWKLKRQA